MEDPRIEALLRDHERRAVRDPCLDPEAEARVRTELAALAAHETRLEARRARWFRGILAAGSLAAAAAVIALLVRPEPPDYGAVPCTVALLDGSGRELEEPSARSDPAPGTPFPRPGELIVELELESPAQVWLYRVDPAGSLGPTPGPQPVRLEPGLQALGAYPLTDLEALPSGPSRVDVLVIASERAVPAGVLADRLPAALEHAAGPERGRELAELAAALERELGVAVTAAGFTLDRR